MNDRPLLEPGNAVALPSMASLTYHYEQFVEKEA